MLSYGLKRNEKTQKMLATHATRLASKGDALTDRGLVDDTMIALASRESILPLLRVLDRFEAMSNHRMNISKMALDRVPSIYSA